MNEPAAALLTAACGAAPTLRRVTASGRASGLLLSMTVRQHYRNDTADTLEVVYTFPLAWGAVLLGLSFEIGEHRLEGTVLPRRQAQACYEEAVAEGDSPIMVEASADGLYTANLGNLKPGEDAVIELRYGQLLALEQGRVRLSVPTTIAPRYGDPVRDAGLRPHESVGASLVAAYPFEFALQVDGALAAGAIASPTHAIEVERIEAGARDARVRLARHGWLDRDLVLTFDGAAGAPAAHAVGAPDGAGSVVLASFRPTLAVAPRESVAVKLLVDCSGSMGGDAIDSARRGLHRALAELRPRDRFAYSRFGSSTVHAFDGLRRADAATIAAASRLVDATEADLGGTETNAALASTFALGGGECADVLLVTDGEVWAIDAIVEAARASGHRVFAVGVGSAPAESLLRRLAEATGGACELVSPNESIEEAIARMFARLRVCRAREVTIDWGAEPLWSTLAPPSVFDGDTVHAVAGFAPGVEVAPRLAFGVDGGEARYALAARVEALAGPPEGGVRAQDAAAPAGAAADALAAVLPRMAAARRIADATARNGMRGALEAWATELAVRHQLVTSVTNLFLVHRRTGADKATDLPTLRQVEQMLAAGWGATGSVRQEAAMSMPMPMPMRLSMPMSARGFEVEEPPVFRRSARGQADLSYRVPEPAHAGRVVPAFLRERDDAARTTPRRLLASVRAARTARGGLEALLRRLERAPLPSGVREALREIEAQGASREEAWLIVLGWLARHFGDDGLPGDEALRALDAGLAGMPMARREVGEQVLVRRFAGATLEAW
jgi:Ca-activated chloride channel family protein